MSLDAPHRFTARDGSHFVISTTWAVEELGFSGDRLRFWSLSDLANLPSEVREWRDAFCRRLFAMRTSLGGDPWFERAAAEVGGFRYEWQDDRKEQVSELRSIEALLR